MPNPPVAKREPHVTEIHGLRLVDDYYWLRNKDTDEVISYLEAENAYTSNVMKHTDDLQKRLYEEMKSRIKETDESVPMKIDEYYYYYRTEEGKDYNIHCRKHMSLDAPEEIILDENLLAEGKEYMRVGRLRISPNHKMLAYSVDFTGGETYTTRVVNLNTHEIRDEITLVGSQIEWDSNCNCFYYSKLDKIHRDYAILRHVIGNKQYDDEMIFEEPDTTFRVEITRSSDKSFLFIYIKASSSETTEIRYIDFRKASRDIKIFYPRTEGVEFVIDHHEEDFYFLTNIDSAINFKMMKTSESSIDEKNWKEIIPHDIEVRLLYLQTFQNYIVIVKRSSGYANLMIYTIATGELHDISLPESIYGLQYISNPVFETEVFRFAFSSPTTPKSVYDYDMTTRILELKKIDEIKDHDPSGYVTERRYAKASDGTDIPISIAYKKGTELNGENPLLLYGYGSYGASSDPHFNSNRLSLINRGLIFAIAHIRGGGEFGKPWYHQGKFKKKMNTFTDFIACAEFLIAENYTSKENLCIFGGSAGGLLIGVVLNLRPDLFGCVVARVPFVDVINTMLDETIPLTTFEFKEWGNPKIKEEFDWIVEYSPYDNIESKEYPPILITAGYNDPRVHYWEPAKWTAKLRSKKNDDNILLLKTKMSSGHSGVSGRYDYMKEIAFVYSFIIDVLNIHY
jgi:oligopeptidase B